MKTHRKRRGSRKRAMKARSMKARSMKARSMKARSMKARSMKARKMRGGNQELFNAVTKGNTTKTNQLLEANANPNEIFEGQTLLHIAAKNGYYEIAELLIDKGADVNKADKDGRTPLFVAAEAGYAEIVELLANNGADINKVDVYKYTPLNAAAESGREDVVEYLIDQGADLDKPSKYGVTPLMSSLINVHDSVASLLIESGANIYTKDEDNNTALFFASSRGFYDIVDVLLEKGADPNIQTIYGETPLYTASDSNYIEIVSLLLENGAAPNIKENNGQTPLFITSENGFDEVVNLLLENGADPNIDNVDGETPLYIASLEGFASIVKLLLKHNAVVTDKIKNEMDEFDSDIQNLLGVMVSTSSSRSSPVAVPLNRNSKPANAPSKCFDPILYSNTNITKEMVTFYIQDKANKTIAAGCLDEDSLNIYKTSNDYVFYRCKDSVPVGALFIDSKSVHSEKYRLLNFDRRIYVKDSEARQLKVGNQYILRPTGEPLGRIASYDVVHGGSAVSSNHCGPADGSIIYKIYQVGEGAVGGRRGRRRHPIYTKRKRL